MRLLEREPPSITWTDLVDVMDNLFEKITPTRGIEGVIVEEPGGLYTGTPQVIFSGGSGDGAEAKAVVVDGVITDIIVTDPGAGYTSTPIVTISGGGGTGAAATAVLSGRRTWIFKPSARTLLTIRK